MTLPDCQRDKDLLGGGAEPVCVAERSDGRLRVLGLAPSAAWQGKARTQTRPCTARCLFFVFVFFGQLSSPSVTCGCIFLSVSTFVYIISPLELEKNTRELLIIEPFVLQVLSSRKETNTRERPSPAPSERKPRQKARHSSSIWLRPLEKIYIFRVGKCQKQVPKMEPS